MTDLDARAAFALDVALRAGQLALAMRHNLAPADAKSAIDFCTEADLAVERLIRQEMAARFGGDSFIGEEYGGEAGEAVWVVDPIDGTAGYIHGTPRWCVSIAFVLAGVIEIGVIYAPVTDRLFVARRGGGARMNGRPIQVSGLRHGAAPVVEAGWSERRPLGAYCELLARLDGGTLRISPARLRSARPRRSRVRARRRLCRAAYERLGRARRPSACGRGRRPGQRLARR